MNSSSPAASYRRNASTNRAGSPAITGKRLSAGGSVSRYTTAWALRAIVDGSRPTAAQWSASTADLCSNVSGVPHVFHSSACRATIFSVRFSPPPPMRIGSGDCTGFGSHVASVSV
jgi:hypothetical protein